MPRSLSIQSPAFPSSLFSPVKLSVSETFNDLFEYTLILKTPDSDPFMDPDQPDKVMDCQEMTDNVMSYRNAMNNMSHTKPLPAMTWKWQWQQLHEAIR